MYFLTLDSLCNRVHITFSERFDVREAEALLVELRSRMSELRAGFSVLCDMTALVEFENDAKLVFRDAMELCNSRGISQVVRIIPNPLHDFGLTIMSCFHYDSKVAVVTCKSLGEAVGHLTVRRRSA